MPEVVQVSNVEKMDKLKIYLEDAFKKSRYSEITQAIGMHSLIVDPEHTMKDQANLFRGILNMVKEKISGSKGKSYGVWYTEFPVLMDKLISTRQLVTDNASLDVLTAHHNAYGMFKSVDDFFFWALDERRLTLDQIIKYIEKTAEMQRT
jgi:predicted ATP-dependent Lon-type protease